MVDSGIAISSPIHNVPPVMALQTAAARLAGGQPLPNDEQGFKSVRTEKAGVRMAASRTDPGHPWVHWTVTSTEKTLSKRVQVVLNSSGGRLATSSSITWEPHWSGFPTSITAVSGTAPTNIC